MLRKNFFFSWVQLLHNVVLVSGVWRSESPLCIHTCSPSLSPLRPPPPRPSGSSQSTRRSSLHYTAATRSPSSLHKVVVYVSVLPSRSPHPPLFSMAVSLFLPCTISLDSVYMCVDTQGFSELLHSVWQTLGPSTFIQMTFLRISECKCCTHWERQFRV